MLAYNYVFSQIWLAYLILIMTSVFMYCGGQPTVQIYTFEAGKRTKQSSKWWKPDDVPEKRL